MAYGRISDAQWDVIRRHVAGKIVHDLGAGTLERARELRSHGAKAVVAIDKEALPPVADPKIRRIRTYFEDYKGKIGIAFVAWPLNTRDAGLLRLVRSAPLVIYVGKNTDGTMCAWPGFWNEMQRREILDYVPEHRNTLIVYGDLLEEPRELRGEERAGIESYMGEKWVSFEEAEGLPDPKKAT